MPEYTYPWFDVEVVNPRTKREICRDCWQEKSITGNCWCGDFGQGIHSLNGEVDKDRKEVR